MVTGTPEDSSADTTADVTADAADSEVTVVEAAAPGPTPPAPAAARPRRRWRTAVAVVLILIGVLLVPVAVVTGWARWGLTDTDRFVATYAPLADDPTVQQYVVDQATAAIDERLNIDGLTQQVVDGLISLGTGPRASAALRTLQSSVAAGLESQIRGSVERFVTSDQFAAAWADALRITHTQLTATLSNDPAAIAKISADGSLGIPLAPIIEQVKQQLVQDGIALAQRIPTINKTIVLVKADQLVTLQVVYALVVAVGTWLPLVVLALLVGGVLVANRRSVALIWAAGGVALTALALVAAIAAGRVGVIAAVPASVMPSSVSQLLYDTATTAMRVTAISTAVLGIAVVVVAWLAAPLRTPTRLRALYGDGVGQLRAAAAERGVTTGKVGVWVHRYRSLLFGLIALLAGLAIFVGRPLTAGLVGWTALLAGLAVIVVTLVERPEPAAAGRPDQAAAG